MIVIFIGFDVSTEINCKVWIILTWTISFPVAQFSSVLMAIRVIAIWKYNKIFIAAFVIIMCAQVGFYIFEFTKLDATWIPTQSACVMNTSARNTQPINVLTLGIDLFLISSILVGLLRWKPAGQFRLWRFLWNQGMTWFVTAIIAEVPAVTFILLNLNEVLNLIFFLPELVILAISAARMYRSLAEYSKSYKPDDHAYNYGKRSETLNNPRVAPRAYDRVSIQMQSMSGRAQLVAHVVDKPYDDEAPTSRLM